MTKYHLYMKFCFSNDHRNYDSLHFPGLLNYSLAKRKTRLDESNDVCDAKALYACVDFTGTLLIAWKLFSISAVTSIENN
jgi:hypothetical protein